MKVGIYGQFYHEHSEQSIQQILNALKQTNVDIAVEKNFLELIKHHKEIDTNVATFSSFTELDHSYDLFFSIGGDGTLLKSITFVRDLGIPIVGINTGRLGFLATIQKEKIIESIAQIIAGNFTISERSLLAIQTEPQSEEIGDLNFALNELAINRKNTTSMIKVETMVDNEHLTSYWSDGLIISTPTGSTGYSLSCGGPIMDPASQCMVLTPIAPHNLNARPLVIPDDVEITLKVSGREKSYLISLDSRIATLEDHAVIRIKKAPFTIKLAQLKDDTFIKTLREKLLWGEDKRN
ncbi:NAD kinase [Pukyongia salina]|uniref:NAD kinase n=1 Tax=Pukyongia salina TaxID=2094025 RepID=A0A2S0HUN4_9FLAO|nr:NAD kinase [Pukyongia salina]AVI50254.1 NAD kinase [Pukyongia salina]